MTRILALAIGLGLAATAAAADKFDAEKLVGAWTVTAGTKDGAKVDKPGGAVTVTKDKLTMTDADGMVFEFALKLDAKADPAAIDMEILAPEAFKGAKAKGIVALDGKTVKLAYHPMGGERPKNFDAKQGTGEHSFTVTAVEKK